MLINSWYIRDKGVLCSTYIYLYIKLSIYHTHREREREGIKNRARDSGMEERWVPFLSYGSECVYYKQRERKREKEEARLAIRYNTMNEREQNGSGGDPEIK